MPQSLPKKFQIDNWIFDCNQNIAWLGKRKIKIEPKAMMILQYISSKPDEIITREELFEKFWPKQVVTEDALNRVMSNLRRMFNDNSNEPKYIATVRKVGYKLVATVTYIKVPDSTNQLISDTNENVLTSSIENSDVPQSKVEKNAHINTKNYKKVAIFSSITLLIFFTLIFSFKIVIPEKVQLNSTDNITNFTRITYDKPENITPSLSPNGKAIAYIEKTGDYRKKLMHRLLQETENIPIGSSVYDYYHPSFSPNGELIALLAKTSATDHLTLNTYDIKKSQHNPQIKLNNISKGLSWHPNANHIAFSQAHMNQANNGIYLWNIKERKQRLLTPSMIGADDTNPLFSPDGGKIAFIRKIAYKEKAIFITNFAGKTQQVTAYSDNIVGFDWIDESHMLVATDFDLSLYSINGDQIKLTVSENKHPMADIQYSKEKNQILFNQKSKQFQGMIIDFNNEIGELPLTKSQTSDVESSISGNGLHLVFSSTRTGKNSLWYRTGNKVHIIKNTQFDAIYDLVWSPNSEILAGIIKENGKYGLLNFHINTQEVKINWLNSSPINLSGWRNNNLVLYSQKRKDTNSWVLKEFDLKSLSTKTISNLDIYQSRLTPNKDKIVFIDSSRQSLWVMGWDKLPQKIETTQNLQLDRNWDIDNSNLFGVNERGNIFKLNLTNSLYKEFSNLKGFSDIQRPQRLIYGLAATKSIRSESDFWISDIVLP